MKTNNTDSNHANANRKARQLVLDKINRSRNTPYFHNFDLNGKCKSCSATIFDLPIDKPLTNLDLMCRVITPEEVARFRDYAE